ncbi:MAG TPA: hypothetical protein VFI42_18625 [Thermomicrobiaceae bacterium]|nr:hypothetical protein [Thermomicrobiaceae bacterium]
MTMPEPSDARPRQEGLARRAALGRQLRNVRWGAVVLGVAATAAFSGLAMHQSSANAGTPATAVERSQPGGADAPSQSLFGDGSGTAQPGASALDGSAGRERRFRQRSSLDNSSGDDGSASSTDPFGSAGSSSGAGLAPAPDSSLGGRVHVRSASS